MSDQHPSQNRRRFLSLLGGAGVVAASPLTAEAEARDTSHPGPIAETWNVAWADRVQGAKYRAVFDSPELSEGAALFRAIGWCDQYKEVYGVARSEMAPVMVIRHNGIPLIMNDEFWKRFKIGKGVKVKDMKGKWAEANPIRVAAPDTPPAYAHMNLEAFMRDGGTILACNWAFSEMVARFRTAEKLDANQARERALAHVIPGVILQPSGVFATLRAQEAGCQYILAS
jgi:hypothetical protein